MLISTLVVSDNIEQMSTRSKHGTFTSQFSNLNQSSIIRNENATLLAIFSLSINAYNIIIIMLETTQHEE